MLQVKDVKIKRVLTFVLGALRRQIPAGALGMRSDERVIHARTALRSPPCHDGWLRVQRVSCEWIDDVGGGTTSRVCVGHTLERWWLQQATSGAHRVTDGMRKAPASKACDYSRESAAQNIGNGACCLTGTWGHFLL